MHTRRIRRCARASIRKIRERRGDERKREIAHTAKIGINGGRCYRRVAYFRCNARTDDPIKPIRFSATIPRHNGYTPRRIGVSVRCAFAFRGKHREESYRGSRYRLSEWTRKKSEEYGPNYGKTAQSLSAPPHCVNCPVSQAGTLIILQNKCFEFPHVSLTLPHLKIFVE